jgi:PPOX class probable F420-dependent enzyme
MASLFDPQVRDFLLEGTRTAHLATVRSDGRPHVAPIWFHLDGDDVVFNTGEKTVKGRNLAREGRASLSVDLPEPPFGFVIVEGEVTLVDDLAQVAHWATQIGGRYMGPERAEEFGARNGVPGELLVRLRPANVIAELAMTA